MKSQKYGLAFILILGVSLLSFYVCGSSEHQPNPGQTQDQALLDLMSDITSIPEEWKPSLAKQISDDFNTMNELFKGKDHRGLAKLLGKRGASLATPGFEKMHGLASEEHWKNLWRANAELKLVPVRIYANRAEEPKLVPYRDVIDEGVSYEDWKKNPTHYDGVAVVIFEYHVVDKGEGQTSELSADPPAAEIYFHKTGCPWG